MAFGDKRQTSNVVPSDGDVALAPAPVPRNAAAAVNVVVRPPVESIPGSPPNQAPKPQSLANYKYPVFPQLIDHLDSLPEIRPLYEEIEMQWSLKNKVCPVEIVRQGDGKKQFALVLIKEALKQDYTDQLVDILEHTYARATPLIYIADTGVLAQLARGLLGEKTNSKKTAFVSDKNSKNESELWSYFLSIVAFCVKNDVSDIHWEYDAMAGSKSQLRFRIDGRLVAPAQFVMDSAHMLDTLAYLYNNKVRGGSENVFSLVKGQNGQIKTPFQGRNLLFRWASMKCESGLKAVFRMLYQDNKQSVRTFEELGYFPQQVAVWKRALSKLGGGIIIAGVVGSGKSTTMQTVLDELPEWMCKVTIEDPVEYIIPGATQINVSRSMAKKGEDPFLEAKRQTKRMDPDAVLVGEIRDGESASMFRDIAESGHRALATIHAPSATDVIALRLVSDELGIPRDVIATPGFLNLLVYQALIPKLCQKCEPVYARDVYGEAYVQRIEKLFGIKPEKIRARNSCGCSNCSREGLPELNGAKGRIPVAEMIEIDNNMLYWFREKKIAELKAYIRKLRKAPFDVPDSTGKSAIEVAMYHVSQGTIDPKDVEEKFQTFEEYERDREIGFVFQGDKVTKDE